MHISRSSANVTGGGISRHERRDTEETTRQQKKRTSQAHAHCHDGHADARRTEAGTKGRLGWAVMDCAHPSHTRHSNDQRPTEPATDDPTRTDGPDAITTSSILLQCHQTAASGMHACSNCLTMLSRMILYLVSALDQTLASHSATSASFASFESTRFDSITVAAAYRCCSSDTEIDRVSTNSLHPSTIIAALLCT